MKNNILVGHTKKAFGTKGEIRLFVEAEFVEDILVATVLFIEKEGKAIPYFVEEVKMLDTLVVKLEEVDSKEVAAKLAGKSILLRSQDVRPEEDRLIPLENNGLFYSQYIGFEVIDEMLGRIGTIERVEEFPQQEMGVLSYQTKEILIPLNETLIVNINEKEKTIKMDLPEGILDL